MDDDDCTENSHASGEDATQESDGSYLDVLPSLAASSRSQFPFPEIDDDEGSTYEQNLESEEDPKPDGFNGANPVSKLFWCWLEPLFFRGLRKRLHQEDLYSPAVSAQSHPLMEKFHKYWLHEIDRGRSPKLYKAMIRILWWKILLNFLLAALKLVLSIGQAVLVGLLSDYFVTDRTAEQTRDAYLYAMGLTLAIFLSAFVHNHGFLQAQEIGMLNGIISSGAMFHKSLSLDQKTLGKFSFGNVISLVSNDVRKLDFAFLYAPYLVLAPLHVVAVLVILWWYIGLGPSCLAGLGLFILWIPMQLVLSKMYAALRVIAAKYTDERMRIVNDFISGIKVIKMFAWESAFRNKISSVRRKESAYVNAAALFRASNDGFYLVFIALFNLFTFVTYTLVTGNPLTPNIVFTSITLVTGLRLSTIVYMVEGILGMQEARVALHRIQEFLDLHSEPIKVQGNNAETDGDVTSQKQTSIPPECNGSTLPHDLPYSGNVLPHGIPSSGSVLPHGIPSSGSVLPHELPYSGNVLPHGIPSSGSVLPHGIPSSGSILPHGLPKKNSVLPLGLPNKNSVLPLALPSRQDAVLSVSHLSANWTDDQSGHTLTDVSFEAWKGEILVIIGPVGSGKSSLLQAILGEMGSCQGSVEITGTIAYTSQEPWVFGGTLRDNVLCGREFKEDWYWKVMEACCLKEDLKAFPLGDFTLVGERGLALSGGQRSRVNLARAVYSKADLYLFDGPLSAVDPEIEHHLFEECICGLLEDSAVVLVTHQLPIAQLSDQVMVVHGGKIVALGTFEDIVDLATVEEDNPQSDILREVFSEMLGDDSDDEEEVEEEEVFPDDAISPPPSTPNLNRKPHFGKTELIRRVTDLALMRQASISRQPSFNRQPSFLNPSGRLRLPPILARGQTKPQMSQPSSSKLRRRSIARQPERWIQRRSTVATVSTDGRGMGAIVGVKQLQGGPLATLAASRSQMHQDGEDLDYTLFAGVARPRAAVLPLQLRFSRTNLASTSKPPPTPTPAKSKRSLATWLANQILEEEEENSETEGEDRTDSETPGVESKVTINEATPLKAARLSLEDTGQGSVTLKTYCTYFLLGSGYLLSVFLCVLFLVSQANIVIADWWLSEWAQNDDSNSTALNLTTAQRAGIYAGLVSSALLMSFARAILFFYICVRAAKKLHSKMLTAVLQVPVRFFDINPSGRIFNRFSKDIGYLDDILPSTFYDYLTIMLQFISILIVSGVANYWIFLVMVVVIVVFIMLRSYYLRTSREIKRLEAVARSPLFSHISTTLAGLPTIRSMNRQQMSLEWYYTLQDEHTKAWGAYSTSTRWFGLRVDLISAVFVGIVAFMAVPLATFVQASLIGLSLSYCVSLAGVFQYGVRLSAEVDSLMISVERLMAYGKLPPEAPPETSPNVKLNEDWPTEGAIKVRELKFRYSAEDPFVLKGITCNIASSEKIGVIGRSGAGKSSLLAALFRLAEPEGVLEIDGVQITDIGLHDLRSKISIIPQEPSMFSGSLRYNVDPLDEYTDEEIWNALEKVEMKAAVQQLTCKLQTEMSEGGGNLSVGQKQLICLARALLRQSKVLVIDEATAYVDSATDTVIQQTLRKEFDKCTVLTIAHRLHTIMDYDRIMVLGGGKLKEMDEPYTLLKSPKSLLSDMVSQLNQEQQQKLKQIAWEARRKRKREGRKRRRSVRIQHSRSHVSGSSLSDRFSD